MPKVHRLKTWTEPFQAVKHNLKPFEIRKNDRNYQAGDYLVLDEWNNLLGEYTDEEPVVCHVGYLLHGGRFGLAEDHVAMAVRKLASEEMKRVILDVAPPRGSGQPESVE